MHDRHPAASLFSQVDITSAGTQTPTPIMGDSVAMEQIRLLRDLLSAQDRQTELLEELVSQVTSAVSHVQAAQRQRAVELGQWKDANPGLARNCREAAEALSRVQTEFLRTLTEEVVANAEVLADGEFMLTEFVDRFGPRLAHLNGVMQVLAQLSGPSSPADSTSAS